MFLPNFVKVFMIRLRMISDGLAALYQAPVAVLRTPGSNLREKIGAALWDPYIQRLGFRTLRAFAPNLRVPWTFITSYPGSGTAIVTRRADVIEVLDRNADFEVVYESRIRAITGGDNFFLGMQDSARYTRDVSNMRLAVRRDDVARIVEPHARALAERLVAGKAGRIDVPPELSLPVPAAIVTDYFGITGAADEDLMDWATLMFRYVFTDLQGDPVLDRDALAAASLARAAIDAAIAKRKASGEVKDDVLGRCLVMQKAGLPGMDDLSIRDNLIGLFIAVTPQISRAVVQSLDQLLDRPEALRSAQQAARDGDDALFAAHVFEAFRFNPLNSALLRRAARDTKIAAGSFRAKRIPKDTQVIAATLSAMFDPLKIDSPESFRTDRPWGDYILFGYGMHGCFGLHINRAVVPAILKPLISKSGLRRAPGGAGQIDTGGTQFPQHFVVEWSD
jgi:cytochrome P450